MKRYLPVVLGLVLIAASAVVQGFWSERWMTFPELSVYAQQFAKVPEEIGEWKSKPLAEPTKKILEAAGAIGSLSREYTNEKGESVSVFLYCGRPQDMLYHVPTKCYGAAGFEQVESENHLHEIMLPDGEVAAFRSARFVKSETTGKMDQQVFWSWCGDGRWEAPDDARWQFPGQRALYKLYLIYTPTRDQAADHNPVIDFIPELVPELNKDFADAMPSRTPTPAKAVAEPESGEPREP